MSVSSPEKGLEGMSHFQKEQSPSFVEEFDINFVLNHKENAEDYMHENLAKGNELDVDNEQGQDCSPSLPSDSRYTDISASPCEKLHSPAQTTYNDDVFMSKTRIIYDQESLHSPSNDNHYQLEAEELRGTNLCKPSQLDVKCLHHENETEVPTCAWESYSMEDANQGEDMEDSVTSPSHDNIVKEILSETLLYESTKSESVFKELEEKVSTIHTKKLFSSPRSHRSSDGTKSENICYSRNSPTERNPELPESPATARQKTVSPERSPCMFQSPRDKRQFGSGKDLKDQSYSSRSQRVKHSASPENSGLGKEICSNDHSPRSNRQDLGSQLESRQRSRLVDGGSLKCVSTSPRNRYSPKNDRRRDRLESPSPVRRRDSSSGYKRDYSNRSRSRSPHTRNHHKKSPYTRNQYRRSPRRRDSPRCKSSPSRYPSYRRSPKRRPWSPPHNRSTGVGKPGRNLFVAGFSFLTTERDLEKKFSKYGRVRDVRIVRDKRSGDSRGFGFLSLERDEEANAAIRALDKTEWNGRIVLVEKSKSH
ncbi:unnamed protein product [Camellia sinensis]